MFQEETGWNKRYQLPEHSRCTPKLYLKIEATSFRRLSLAIKKDASERAF
jgi:hypothetical protein